jgi:hypothetical protein
VVYAVLRNKNNFQPQWNDFINSKGHGDIVQINKKKQNNNSNTCQSNKNPIHAFILNDFVSHCTNNRMRSFVLLIFTFYLR